MKILMLVNWKVEYSSHVPEHKQPPDYDIKGKPYWFYQYFDEPVEVDVVDTRSFSWLEEFEKEKLRFYIWQTLRMIPKLGKYDLIVSHGMQSGIVLSLLRRLFFKKVPHIVFEIGSFNSAATSGGALKLMQFASKSINGIIYHTSRQIEYYREYFPWIAEKARFIPFGTDVVFFEEVEKKQRKESAEPYILCVGYIKRDWDTLIKAYQRWKEKHKKDEAGQVKLRMIGKVDDSCKDADVEMIPYIPIDELKQQIAEAMFCVVPLEYFNYSFGQMTLLQQMAMGKAVITAKVPSMQDYVQDGYNALFYEPYDEESLLDKMERLINDEELRECLGRQAVSYVKEYHNEQRMAKEVEKFFKEVVDR